MADNNGAGAGTVLLAFLVGAVAGAAVALLYAPVSGKETREFLEDKARAGKDVFRAGAEAIKDVYQQATGDKA